jgi:hypothetical protein
MFGTGGHDRALPTGPALSNDDGAAARLRSTSANATLDADMPWPTWNQAALAAVLSAAFVFVARRTRPTRFTNAMIPAAQEFALISTLYSVWRVARELPLAQDAGAIDRGRQIDRLQQAIGLPTELSLQHFALDHELLARTVNYYYATLHVPALIIFLVWLFVRHRDAYPHWRTGLVLVTACCLVIRFMRVAPPRLVPELGFVNLSSGYGWAVYGEVGTGVSDQFAAMPSIHVAWAAVVAFGAVAVSSSPWRWLVFLHLPLTMYVVAATGHHWWLDSIVAIALLALALGLDTAVRRRVAEARESRVQAVVSRSDVSRSEVGALDN